MSSQRPSPTVWCCIITSNFYLHEPRSPSILPPFSSEDLFGYYNGFIMGNIESRDQLCPPRNLWYLLIMRKPHLPALIRHFQGFPGTQKIMHSFTFIAITPGPPHLSLIRHWDPSQNLSLAHSPSSSKSWRLCDHMPLIWGTRESQVRARPSL